MYTGVPVFSLRQLEVFLQLFAVRLNVISLHTNFTIRCKLIPSLYYVSHFAVGPKPTTN